MPERHLRNSSTFLAIWKMQIRMRLRQQVISVRMTKIKNTNESLFWRGIAGWSVRLYSHVVNQYGSYSSFTKV